ncbi:MAG: CusA/CzcA family heavy metal efflux RND transporter [Lentimicrobiaceae bacterium]|nr:CusA/CzcA family heavy metal efflux RND transporter [Lentimicrobiaceae bacterium]HPG33397.1 CusA/CzcA family heavy metal efflux RND transporter [Lentimicrobium sp.]
MLDRIIHFSIHNKLIIILFTLSVAAFGLYSLTQIPVGAVPDITNNQVQVITTSGNLSTQDVEQFITYPVELEMANLPGVKEIRSVSKFGLSVVTIVFEDKTGTYLPRQLIAEKIKSASANIPEGFGTPEMGPITTGLGEIYQYILDTKPGYENRYSPMELRTIQDWVVKRQLSGIPGVVEINTWGGYLKQYEIALNPETLNAFGLSIGEVFEAISKNNSVAGGAYIEKQQESYFVRGEGLVSSVQDIESIVVRTKNGIPILIRDIAEVRFGHANRFGAITGNGQGEKVLGQIMMLKNANSNKVITEVKSRVAELQKTLPEGVYINPVLERSELIAKTTFTVSENLILGCLIVIFVVVLLLGNFRSGMVIASLIPLSLLFTISMMYIFGIDANLMSLGAIDFGIIIDGAVIIVEYIALRLTVVKDEFSASQGDKRQILVDSVTFEGASKMMNSAIFGQFIILLVFIPILSLSGVEGKMFRPMALSFSFALVGAIIFCLTWLPVAASLFLKPEKEVKKSVSKWIMHIAYKSYKPVIEWSYDHKKIIFGSALASLVLVGFLYSRMGGEFVPTLDEGDFVIQPVLKTGTSLSKTIEMTTQMENILIKKFPEVDQIVSRIGAAEVPTDPMSMEESDIIIKLKPKSEWVSAKSKDELADKFKEALSVIPGIEYEFTQPIEMRFNELITGVRADVAVKIFGEDMDVLNQKAFEVKRLIEHIDGAADVIVEKTAGLPQMSVKYRRDKLARYGMNAEDLNRIVSAGFGGAEAGSVFEGEKRFDMVIRLKKDYRRDIENLENLRINLPDGQLIPLSELADITYTTGPAKISRDNTHRRVVVSINVRNRDMESVVKDVELTLNDKLKLPPGYYISYGGQFENLRTATARLKIAVPVALLLIFIFLHFAFGSIKEAAMVFTAIPLATVGGVLLLWLRGMPFSISAGVGFIALFGIAVLNGIVLIEHLKELKEHGITDMRERIMKGTMQRLRPVMLTAAAAALGFLPMAISTSAGAEVQRPLATVVIGGLITSTMLTMLALPLLYAVFDTVTGIQLWPFKLKRSIPVLLLLLLPAMASMAQNKTLSPEQAVAVALQNNQSLKADSLRTEQSKASLPAFSGLGKTGFYYGFDQNNIAENNKPLYIIGAEQFFSFPGLLMAQRKTGKAEINASENAYYLKIQVLTKNVLQSYYNLLYLKNVQQRFRHVDSIYSGFSKAAGQRYERGETSYLEMLNAQSKHEQIRMRKRQSEQETAKALIELKKLLQTNEAIDIVPAELQMLAVIEKETGQNPLNALYASYTKLQQSRLKVERASRMPEFTLSWFNGTNSYAGAKNYYGYQAGIALPLFFGGQNARIKSARLGVEVAQAEENNLRIELEARKTSLQSELGQYYEAIDYYNKNGKSLASEIYRTAQQSYQQGDADFFQFIQSLETANEIEINYLYNLSEYNRVVLELNYLTFN